MWIDLWVSCEIPKSNEAQVRLFKEPLGGGMKKQIRSFFLLGGLILLGHRNSQYCLPIMFIWFLMILVPLTQFVYVSSISFPRSSLLFWPGWRAFSTSDAYGSNSRKKMGWDGRRIRVVNFRTGILMCSLIIIISTTLQTCVYIYNNVGVHLD